MYIENCFDDTFFSVIREVCCRCSATLSQHPGLDNPDGAPVNNQSEPWSQSDLQTEDTDAYGLIDFGQGNPVPAKVVFYLELNRIKKKPRI